MKMKKHAIKAKNCRQCRKGAAHIEMIVSFVLFISFLIFILAFANPAKRAEPGRALIGMIWQEIEKNSSVNVTAVSLSLNSSVSGLCFKLNLEEIGISGIIGNNNVTIKNEGDNVVQSKKSGYDLFMENTGNFYKIFSSEELNATSYTFTGCEPLQPEDVDIGQAKTKKEFSFKRLMALNSSYWQDYGSLKQRLGFPKGNDFGFALISGNTTMISALKEKPSSAVVISDSRVIELIYDNATSSIYALNIQVW